MLSSKFLAKAIAGSLLRASALGLAIGLMPVAAQALTASVTAIIPAQGMYPGETATLRITLSNSDPVPITNVDFSNSLPGLLPNGLSVASAATNGCGGAFTATPGTQALALAGGTIPAAVGGIDGQCVIDIPVTVGTSTGNATSYAYQILNGAVTSSGGSNVGDVSQTFVVRALQQPQISKAFTSSTLVLGGASTPLTITLVNPNPVAISGFSITDNFPQLGGSAIMKVAAAPGANATCTSGPVPAFNPAPAAGATSVTGTGDLPANGSCTFVVNVEANQTNGQFSTGAQNNIINRSTDFTNVLGLPAQANAQASVTVRSPLGMSKGFTPSTSLSSGASGFLTLTLSNSGNTPLTVTTFDDTPIDGIGGVDPTKGLNVTSAVTSCAGGAAAAINSNKGVRLTGGTIPANGSCTVTVNFTAAVQANGVPVTYTNSIPQGAVDVGDPAIKSQAVSATILVADDLRVLKSVQPTTPVAPGNPIQYQITVQNFGAGAINTVSVTDNFTNGQTFLTGTINGFNYTPTVSAGCGNVNSASPLGSNAPVFTIDTVPARTSVSVPGACTITMWAMASTVAVATSNNVIAAGGVCYNGGATCNGGASNSTSVGTNPPVLAATKAFAQSSPGASTFAEGTIVRMTITLTNKSANPLTNVAVSDTLQLATSGGGQLRIASPANAASTCGAPAITAVAGSTSIGITGGTVPARANNGMGADGSCTLQVDVVGPAGVYNNTATVDGTETYGNGTTHTLGTVSTNTPQLTYTSALTANKSFNPSGVSSGGKSTVTVQLLNSSALALTNVSVTDPLPAGMVLATPPNAQTTCAGSTSITAVAGAGSATLTGANVAGGGNCAFLFDVVATGAVNWVNSIPPNGILADGGVRNVTAVVGTLLFNAPTGLAISKTTSISSLAFPGQVSRLTINISNGSQAVTNLDITDYFTVGGVAGGTNNGWVVTPTPATATTCPGGVVTAAAGARSVRLSGANLAANATCQVSVNVTSAVTGGNTNTIPPGAIITDQNLTNANPATTSLAISTNIGIVKQFTPNVVAPGTRSRLRITFYNPLSQPVSDLAVTDTLPAGVTVPSGANPTTTCQGATVSSTANTVQLSGGIIVAAAGNVPATCQVEIDVFVAAQGDYVNTIPANALTATAGGNALANTQPTSDTLRARSPIVVHKAFSARTLDAGSPVGFTTGSDTKAPGAVSVMTIRFDNPNNTQLNGMTVTDALPAGLVVAPTPAAATTCAGGTVVAAASATSVRLTGAALAANGFCTVTVNVLSNISGVYTNTIPTGSITTTEGVTNQEPTSAQLITSTPPTVGKQFAPAVIPPSGVSRLSIVIGNTNAAAMTLSADFDDILPTAPGQIRLTATPNMTTTCGGTVVAAANATSVRLNSGGTIPAGGCTIDVNVTGLTAGVHTNNIPAGALQTNLGNNQAPANATLTISTLGYISGKVFRDNNVTPNGTFQNGTDTGIAGVGIELRSGANCSGALLTTGTTDALGNYLFSSLAAGSYSVCQPAQPAGTTNGITTAGPISGINGSTGSAGAASNPTATTSQITNVVLNGDGGAAETSGSANNNFAEVVPSTISGKAFKDLNNNGAQDGADDPLAGVTIELRDAGNALIATTVTDATGNYSFGNLLPGTYTVVEPAQPAGTSNGITTAGAVPNGGTPGTATTPAVTSSRISSIVLPPNTVSSGNNFAEVSNGGTISGKVFLDYDNSGLMNGSDHGIGGQTINLTGTDINGLAVSRSTVTLADGTYSFTGLAQGTYTVTQPLPQATGTTNGQTIAGSTGGTATLPANPVSSISTIPLASANAVSADNNFAEIPGNAPDLAIAKTHAPVSFAQGSSTGFYTIAVSNVGAAATSATVTVVDTLPVGMTVAAVNGGATWSCSNTATIVTCNTNSVIASGATAPVITVRVAVAAGLSGQVLVNTAVVSGGNEPSGFSGNNTATDPTAISDVAAVQGSVWRDLNHDRIKDPGEPLVPGWIVELTLGGVVVGTTTSDANGAYSFPSVAPGSGYQIRFREPTSGRIYGRPVPNETGLPYTNGQVNSTSNPAGANNTDGTLRGLTLTAGTTTLAQSLPLDPSGVIYDAVSRQPVPNAIVTLSAPGLTAADVIGGSLTQTTGADGSYQFLLLGGAPAGATLYTLTVTSPPGYLPGPSAIIPACTATLGVGLAPPSPDPALVQNSNFAPTAGVPLHNPAACPSNTLALAGGAATTQYFYTFTFAAVPGSANVLNNHIPLDPVLGGAIVMTKSTPLVNVVRGDLVPYNITATNTLNAVLGNINIVDVIPAGFRYRTGSASLNGVALEPTVSGRNLTWAGQTFTAGERKTLRMLLVVGSGVSEGTYVNQVAARNALVNAQVSNTATATVRVVPDPTFDCSDIIGKVFDDKNANGYQDEGEPGIANVRIATARGLLVTSDHDGRFHVACAAIPNADRGSNFVMKVDERTLPSGYRLTTENPRDVRVTRGKMVKLNFGATVHRVVRLELSGAAFLNDGTELQPAYLATLEKLPSQLAARPSILRIAYRRGAEAAGLAEKRVSTISDRIQALWKERRKKERAETDSEPLHPLMIETELESAK
jgi:large repetitive protein